MKFVIAVILFSVLILFHELGHFLLAKKNGIRVNEFCLGLGPTIAGFTKGETKYSLKLFPIGGACIMEGEDEDSEDSRSFNKKSVWARISVVAAGPIFNFILAFICACVLIGCHGYAKPVLSGVMDGYPAQEAGMQAGDQIVRLNHKQIHMYDEISAYTFFHQGETIEVTYERDGRQNTVTIQPQYSEEQGRYLMGFQAVGEYVRTGPLETLEYGFYNMTYWIWYTVESLKMLVTHQIGLSDLSGPVGIVKTVADTYEQSLADGLFYVFLNMLNIAILLSANLGVVNLLPLPALDGGRLVFLFIEAIRRKRVDPDREGMVHFIGLMCLFALMIFVVFNDVQRLI